VGGGIDLALAGLNLLVWLRSRNSWPNLLFAIAAFSAVAVAMIELRMMHAQTPDEYIELFRWMHVPMFCLIISLAWFVHFYLGGGRVWLVWLLTALRVLALLANYLIEPSMDFRAVTGMHPISFGGETLVIFDVEPNPWHWLSQSSTVLLIIVVLDSSREAWRQGNRRSAAVVGGTMVCAVLAGLTTTIFFHSGKLPVPYNVSLIFLLIVMGVSYELAMHLIRANELSRELQKSQQRIELAARAVNLGLWEWDIARDEFWSSGAGRERIGAGASERIHLARVLQSIHPEDRKRVVNAIRASLDEGHDLRVDYRAIGPDGQITWIEAIGYMAQDEDGKAKHLRGVTIDISARKAAAAALQQSDAKLNELRNELVFAQRVSVMGQLSSTLAHELNQPLGAILRNAEAGELLLQQCPPDLEEVQAILVDIRRDEHRAIAVIERMRSLLRGQNMHFETLSVEELVGQVMALLQPEANARRVRLHQEMPAQLPGITGDRVQLQQVLVNLLLNSMDALDGQAGERRQIVIKATQSDHKIIDLAVIDRGTGIPQDFLPHVFGPFRSTKPKGTGLGLAISKTIIESHGGRIFAENNPDGGATIRFTLRIAEQQVIHE